MAFQVLDPTNEVTPPWANQRHAWRRWPARRSASSPTAKRERRVFFAHLDRRLREEFGVAQVVMRVKSNFSAPADRTSWRKSRVGRRCHWDRRLRQLLVVQFA